MSKKIDDNMLEYVGILAQLELEGEDKEKLRSDMEKMLDYVDMLGELDTEGVEPLVQAIDLQNVFREDVVSDSSDREEMLGNAPVVKDGQFVVPRTI